MMARRRIPETIRLPFGFAIKVRQISTTEMAEEAECAPDDAPDGLWDSESRTIYIKRSLPVTRRRYVLCHELEHAATDLTHQQLNDGVGKP